MSEQYGDIDNVVDLHEVGLGREELYHVCLGLDVKRLALAKDLQRAGMAIVEDSPDGPMVTRTFRGTMTLKKFAEPQEPAHD